MGLGTSSHHVPLSTKRTVPVTRNRGTLSCFGTAEREVSTAFNLASFDLPRDGATININEASEEQLMTLPEIDRRTARNIVQYRNAFGKFRKVEDLAVVSGIGALKLDLVCSEITTVPVPSDIAVDIYEYLSVKSPRPLATDNFTGHRDGRKVVRVATWNLDKFDDDKARNLGVIEVICMTILETGVTLVAFQHVYDKGAIETLCQELNNSSLTKTKAHASRKGFWKFLVPEVIGRGKTHLAFLYDSTGMSPVPKTVQVLPESLAPSEAYFATFSVGEIEVSLLNVYLTKTDNNPKPSDNGIGLAAILKTCLLSKNNGNVVVLGDFGPWSGEHAALDGLNFKNIVWPDDRTSMSEPEALYGNIWIKDGMSKLFTGAANVVQRGLTHLAIPNGWSLGGRVSGQCPVWAEFFVTKT